MNKAESKYFHTAVKMDEALLSLLERKDFQYITVKEICGAAGVNRSTFYLHYETLEDLLGETVEYVLNKFREKFDSHRQLSPEQIFTMPKEKLILITPEYLIPYLEFVKENKRIFAVTVSQPQTMQANKIFSRFLSDIIYPIMTRFGLKEYEIHYKLTFYLQGIVAVVCQWVKNGFPEDEDTIADLLIHCIFPEGGLLP
ncbi:MAG: TetR/AcrR family transcriptional regulator [Oscillospiraceae bacterium]|nr:TetR/AcrR family transcriptional regulator [Oscillospiraceae bacterium]